MNSTLDRTIAGEGGPRAEEERLEARSAALTAGAPASILVAPWGEVESANGSFVVDAASAAAVIEAFGAQRTDLPIDYEHQTLGGVYASPTGQAPAAGWIRALRAVGPEAGTEAGLFADVEWTEPARAKLLAREYRYLSPVVLVRKRDRRMVALHSAALTNKPAIIGMRPIVNTDTPQEAMPSDIRGSLETLRLRMELPENADGQTVLLAAERRIRELTRHIAERDADDRVNAAAREGKVPPALRDWARTLALTDPATFAAWASAAPAAVTLGRLPEPASHRAGCGREHLIASARQAFRAEPALALLTSEAAWIRESLREAGIEAKPEA